MFDCLTNFCTYIGYIALFCFLYDNLRSPFLLLKAYWERNYSGKKVKSLSERYGKWAGKFWPGVCGLHEDLIMKISATCKQKSIQISIN